MSVYNSLLLTDLLGAFFLIYFRFGVADEDDEVIALMGSAGKGDIEEEEEEPGS
jgi:hypothetical protein